MNDDMLTTLIKKAMVLEDRNFGKRDWKDRLLVLNRELGLINHNLFYAFLTKQPTEGQQAYKLNAYKEMTDLAVQVRAFCIFIGWDYDKLVEEGAAEYLSKMESMARDIERRNQPSSEYGAEAERVKDMLSNPERYGLRGSGNVADWKGD